jgi:hypothetical protein
MRNYQKQRELDAKPKKLKTIKPKAPRKPKPVDPPAVFPEGHPLAGEPTSPPLKDA